MKVFSNTCCFLINICFHLIYVLISNSKDCLVCGIDNPLGVKASFLSPFFPDDLFCSVCGILKMKFIVFLIMQIATRATSILAIILFMSGNFIPYSGWGIPVLALVGILAIIAFLISYKYLDKIEAFFLCLARIFLPLSHIGTTPRGCGTKKLKYSCLLCGRRKESPGFFFAGMQRRGPGMKKWRFFEPKELAIKNFSFPFLRLSLLTSNWGSSHIYLTPHQR